MENRRLQPDQDSTRDRYIIWFEASRKWFAFAAIGFAAVGLGANLFDVPLALYAHARDAATTPLTVIATTLLALAILGCDRSDKLQHFGQISACLAFLVAILPQFIPVLKIGSLQSGLLSGAVGLDTSVIVALLSVSVLFRFQGAVVGLAAGLSASALILNALIGQSYDLPYFDGEMAFMTFLALTSATVATAAMYLHRPLVRVMFLSSAIGFRTRLMMGVGFVVPWVCGFMLYHWYGVPEREFNVEAVLISVIIWIMLAVTLASGFVHEKADKERRATERQLAHLALHDPLTGLHNRAGLSDALAHAWYQFRRFGTPSAILLIDLDHFKSINDTFGHDVGDLVLKSVRGALRPHLREEDVTGRWGGEEFLCLLHNTDLRHLHRISERLRFALSEIPDQPTLSHGKGRIPVTASIGVSVLDKSDRSYQSAIKRADDALYAAKRNGRNKVVFDPALRPPDFTPSLRGNALTA